MDLHAEVNRLRLDLLAVRTAAVLTDAGIPHILIKGPSTAHWLYDPPRPYADVDLLVPYSAGRRAGNLLAAKGIAEPKGTAFDEGAGHSWELVAPDGSEIDLHVTLPGLVPRDDRLFEVLSAHVEPMDLGVGQVPVLDEAGRCLVVALHAVQAHFREQPVVDLRRARQQVGAPAWNAALALATELDVADLYRAGLAVVEDVDLDGVDSPYARLMGMDAPGPAYGVHRLLALPPRRWPGYLWRELFPTRAFMISYYPQYMAGKFGLFGAYLRRYRDLVVQTPDVVRALRRARRG